MPRDVKNDECESCGFECQVTEYDSGPPTNEKHYACDMCAGTMTSRYACELSGMQPSNTEVMKTICYVGNVILATIRAAK